MDKLLIIAWNVNDYRKKIHEYMKVLISTRSPDIIFLSETKVKAEVLSVFFSEFHDYKYIINSHDPAWYHGVAMLVKNTHSFEKLEIDLGVPARKDTNRGGPETGRLIAIKLEKMIVVGTYTPNAGRELSHLPYRIIAWDRAFFNLLNNYRKEMPTILIGDINVAFESIDVSNVEKMSKFAGFTPQERESFKTFMDEGWIDVWRTQNPGKIMYTWRGDHSIAEYGMRLDNIIVSPELLKNAGEAFIIDDCIESDHICVGCEFSM